MGFLIDSNVFIESERGRFSLADLLAHHSNASFLLAAITASELLHGVYRAKEPHIAEKRRSYVEHILSEFPVLPFDVEVARSHAQIWALLQSRGQIIGAHDLLIAATALAHSHAVLTVNSREFERVPGLMVVNPLS